MQRPTFCAPYQATRRVAGQPMCSYTSKTCPFGLHACMQCGKSGHGAEDCRTRPPPEQEPPAEQAPPPAAQPKTSAVFVPGFGCKGEGNGKLWCCHCSTQLSSGRRSLAWSSAVQQFLKGSGGRGSCCAIDSSTNSSNNNGCRGVDEWLQTAHEHQIEVPSRSW